MSRRAFYPKVMCTIHPDSASKYIPMQEEPEEALEAAVTFGCEEYSRIIKERGLPIIKMSR
jgi:phosphoenolpyruvate carboxylase